MYLYFDSQGTLREIINDTAIRLGNDEANTVYAYFDGVSPANLDVGFAFEKPDGTMVEEDLIHSSVVGQIPYDRKRDLSFFEYYKDYRFFKYPIRGSVLSEAGTYRMTIRLIRYPYILATGEVLFNAENGVVAPTSYITVPQYDKLLEKFAEVAYVDRINEFSEENTFDASVYVKNGIRGDDDSEIYFVRNGTGFTLPSVSDGDTHELALDSDVETIYSYFTDGKANRAIADGDGNAIASTYATKSELSSEIGKITDGTYTAYKATRDGDGNVISSTYGKLVGGGAFSPQRWSGYQIFSGVLGVGGGGYFTNTSPSTPAFQASQKGALAFKVGAVSSQAVKYVLPYDPSDGSSYYGKTYTIAVTSYVDGAKQQAITTANENADAKIQAAITDLTQHDATFSGNVTVGGDLTVNGTMTSVDTQTISTHERFIQMMKGNTVSVSGYTGLVWPKYDGTDDFFMGLQGDVEVLGKVTATLNPSGDVTAITPISLIPLAGRADADLLRPGYLLTWDSNAKKLVDSGYNPGSMAEQWGEITSAWSGMTLTWANWEIAEGRRDANLESDVINAHYAITQAEYNTLMADGVFGVHFTAGEKVVTVYASEALAEAAEETYIFPIQDNVQYPAKGIGGDSPYLNIPAPPQSDGNYVLKCSVLNGTITYAWEVEQ